ncbi:phage tail tape measure protein [Sphingomonas sp. S-NIH.Pt1_0416]|uniref:phage tail tape measure protein n=1 Tax=Sphingomonas sp. S-NIH.Pt1_0416 TaxID=1920123 RepID=UPI000F7FA38E|nr:phage tail tape measure protein [Sphingomonas sp. S-NIH.Pt1_0416]
MEGMLASLTFGMSVRDAAFRSALATDRAELQRTERQFRQSGDGMSAAMRDAAREINRAALSMIDSLSRAADRVRNAGLIMTAGLTVPMAVAGKAAKDTASDFQVAMNKVQAAMLDASPEQLQKLRDAALELGPAYGKSAIEAAGAIENLAKNGMDAASILGGGLAGALALGVVGQTNLGDAADATTDILQQFHISAGQLPTIVDKVSGALDASKLSFDGYKDAIGQVGGIAGGLGYQFEDMNTALAAVIPLMTGGSDAGTSFKTFLLALVPQSKDAADVMDKLGLSFFNANGSAKSLSEVATQLNEKLTPLTDKSRQTALTKMFGTDGMRVAIALMQAGAKGIADVQAQIDKASANQKMAVLLDGEAAATQRVASAWEKLKIVVGEAGIIQAFTMVKEATASVLSVLASGPPWFYKIMVAVGLFAASLGPLTLALLQVAKIGLPLLLLRLGPVALGIAAIINPMGVLIRLLGQLALQVGAATLLGRLGTALIGVAGPIGILITGLSILVPLFLRKANASAAATEALRVAEDADRKAIASSLELASATGKVREALLAKAQADRVAARDAVIKANADLQAAKAAYVRAKADAANPMNFATNVGAPGAVNVATYGRGATVERTRADLEARIKQTETAIGTLEKINAMISAASATVPDKVDMSFDDEKKTNTKKGRDAAQDETNYLDEIGRARVELLRAQADMTEDARTRHRADLAALEEDRASYARQLELDKGLTDAKRQTLLAKRDEVVEIQRGVIDQTLFRAETQKAYDLAKAENDAQQDNLRAPLDLVDSMEGRRNLELKLLDLQRQQEEADLELILATKATSSAEWDNARMRKDQLDKIYADRRASVERQTEGPGATYLREINGSASAINERIQDGAVGALRNLNTELTDAIMGTKSLSDAFANMGKRIVATLIDIAVQQKIIRPLAEKLLGDGSSGSTGLVGSLGSIFGSTTQPGSAGIVEGDQTTKGSQTWLKSLGGFFRLFGGGRATGGPVDGNQWYLVGERGPELFAPGVNGTVIPNGGLRPAGGASVEVRPSPYFDAVVDGRAARVAQPIATDMTSAGLRTAGRAQSWRARQTVR